MSKEKTIQEKTSADSKSIGFDYQYYYFFYTLLQLEEGQSVGLEVRDDVHIERSDGYQALIQLKHSVEKKADGNIKNLTEKDEDLWKTISNWIDMVNDKAEGRSTQLKQLSYIKNTDFVLVSNKSTNSANKFLDEIVNLQNGKTNLNKFKSYLESLKSTPAASVDKYIQKLITQKDKWLDAFLRKVTIKLEEDELINKIKSKIKGKNVPENRIDDVFAAIDSNLRQSIYEDIKKRKKVVLTFEEYYRRYTKYYELARNRKLPIRLGKKKQQVPSDASIYLSVKQLIDAEIIDPADEDYKEQLLNIFTNKHLMYNNLEEWSHNAEITEEQVIEFKEQTITFWQNTFNGIHFKLKRKLRKLDISEITEDELIELAGECYYEILKKELVLDETELGIEMSNGQFYLLSDQPSIGWLYNWEELYKEK